MIIQRGYALTEPALSFLSRLSSVNSSFLAPSGSLSYFEPSFTLRFQETYDDARIALRVIDMDQRLRSRQNLLVADFEFFIKYYFSLPIYIYIFI